MVCVGLDPVLVHLGPLALSWYGLAVGAGVLLGIWLTLREAAARHCQRCCGRCCALRGRPAASLAAACCM
jgi:prolipoprotein diacylglyceryltransferase